MFQMILAQSHRMHGVGLWSAQEIGSQSATTMRFGFSANQSSSTQT
jgi:hypothetical protein